MLLLLSAHVWECVSGGLCIHPSRLSIWRPRNLLCLSGSPCLHLNPWVSGGRVLLTICVPLARACGLPVPLCLLHRQVGSLPVEPPEKPNYQ